ncbi:uncharacterized protein PRCAT00001612001 [Priceomyces carsonii]|uniref:uncharacterized protein n=1 Tax=Priceomyces carsonii TaxID=28549 RepID=UPI002EDB08AF|nr:unnamed protein product [Priceomyces carsonii]
MDTDNNLCSVCLINNRRYTCPACGIKTCSMECVRRHKRQTECSGQIDQTKFISKSNLSRDSVTINRDYNFLLDVSRKIQLGKNDVKANAKNVFKRQPIAKYSLLNNKRSKGPLSNEKNDTMIAAVYRAYPNNPLVNFKRQNTLIIQVPSGMSRSTSNKSGYDKRLGTYIWTIEWVLLGSNKEEICRFISYRLKETLSLKDAVPLNIINRTEPESAIEKRSLHFYLENVVNTRDPRTFISLSRDSKIIDALKNKIIIEYPTFYITLNEECLKDDTLGEDEAYQIDNAIASEDTKGRLDDTHTLKSGSESKAASDSDSDSDSEGSESESVSDIDTESVVQSKAEISKLSSEITSDDNTSDDVPEESSSKETS